MRSSMVAIRSMLAAWIAVALLAACGARTGLRRPTRDVTAACQCDFCKLNPWCYDANRQGYVCDNPGSAGCLCNAAPFVRVTTPVSTIDRNGAVVPLFCLSAASYGPNEVHLAYPAVSVSVTAHAS